MRVTRRCSRSRSRRPAGPSRAARPGARDAGPGGFTRRSPRSAPAASSPPTHPLSPVTTSSPTPSSPSSSAIAATTSLGRARLAPRGPAQHDRARDEPLALRERRLVAAQGVAQELAPGHHVESVTNGVHLATWAAPAFEALFDQHLPGWRVDNDSLRYASAIALEEITAAHRRRSGASSTRSLDEAATSSTRPR